MSYNLISQSEDICGKRILVRMDYNVPISLEAPHTILDNSKISLTLPTIQYLVDKNAIVVLMSHLGRPKTRDAKLSLRPIAEKLSELISRPVQFLEDCVGTEVLAKLVKLNPGQIVLLENLR